MLLMNMGPKRILKLVELTERVSHLNINIIKLMCSIKSKSFTKTNKPRNIVSYL